MKPYHRLLTALLCAALLAGCGIAQRGVEQIDAPRAAPVDPTEGAPAPAVSLGSTILMDGELVSAAPALKLSFPSGASGELLALDVRVGQRVQAGDRIATIDDGELQRAVQNAERALERATEDRERAQTDAEETYGQQRVDAQEQYEEELRQAERTLAAAQNALERAGMQPRRPRRTTTTSSPLTGPGSRRASAMRSTRSGRSGSPTVVWPNAA